MLSGMRRVKEEPVGLDIGYDSTNPGKVRKKNDENRMERMAAGDLPAYNLWDLWKATPKAFACSRPLVGAAPVTRGLST